MVTSGVLISKLFVFTTFDNSETGFRTVLYICITTFKFLKFFRCCPVVFQKLFKLCFIQYRRCRFIFCLLPPVHLNFHWMLFTVSKSQFSPKVSSTIVWKVSFWFLADIGICSPTLHRSVYPAAVLRFSHKVKGYGCLYSGH